MDRSPPAPLRSRGLLSDRLGDTGRRRRRFRPRRDRRAAIARRSASVPRLAADDRPSSERSAARPRPLLSRCLLLLVSARLDALGFSREEPSCDDDQRGSLVARFLRAWTPSPPCGLQMQAAARRSSTRWSENRDSRSHFDTCFAQGFRPPVPVDDRFLLDGPAAPGGLVDSSGRQSALAHRRGPRQRRHADDDPNVDEQPLRMKVRKVVHGDSPQARPDRPAFGLTAVCGGSALTDPPPPAKLRLAGAARADGYFRFSCGPGSDLPAGRR